MTGHDDELRAAEQAALQFANSLRAIDGRDPLPALCAGAVLDCQRCPIANTANMGLRDGLSRWEVGAVAVKIGPRSGRVMATAPQVPVPSSVLAFMAAFDAGAFPEFEVGRMAVEA